MTREQAVRALLAEYESRRASNRAEERRRLAEIDSLAPSVVDALRKREDLIMSRIQKIFNRPADADVVSAELAGRMQALHEEARRALCKLNYPADYLEPVFDCKLCQDRGETGEPPRRWCSCFQRRLVRLLCSDEGMAALQ